MPGSVNVNESTFGSIVILMAPIPVTISVSYPMARRSRPSTCSLAATGPSATFGLRK
jgi:hypothetical protein